MNQQTLTDNLAIYHGYNENPLLFRRRTFTLDMWLKWIRKKRQIQKFFRR